MPSTAALVWYLVAAGPQGGLVVMPSYFDTRDECTVAVTEYLKQPAQAGWSVQCLPGASPYGDEDDPANQTPPE